MLWLYRFKSDIAYGNSGGPLVNL
ncbi:hypothetical protein cypCar_00048284, partial [Cyprinus carpio]